MLMLFIFYSGLILFIEVIGDMYVDDYYIIEDIGIVIG